MAHPAQSVLFTVDDGYKAQASTLSAAAEYEIPLLLFITGQALLANPATWQAAREAGHTIGCHSFAHRPASRLSLAEFQADLQQWTAAARQILGYETAKATRFFRFPYGDVGGPSQGRFAAELELKGWEHMSWDVDMSFSGRNAFTHPQEGFQVFATAAQAWTLHRPLIALAHFKEPDNGALSKAFAWVRDSGIVVAEAEQLIMRRQLARYPTPLLYPSDRHRFEV